jgi:hypothetical protein
MPVHVPATMSRDGYRPRQLGPYTYSMAEGQATNKDKPTGDDETEPARAKNEQSRPSADKRWKVRGVIAAAAITAVVGGVAIVVALTNHSSGETASVAPPSTTAARGPAGSISKIYVDHPGGDITVSGVAGPGVDVVYVLVRRASGEGYLAGYSNVASDLTWRVTVASGDGQAASPLQVMAFFHHTGGSQPGGSQPGGSQPGGSQPGTPACTSPECLSQLGPPAISVM